MLVLLLVVLPVVSVLALVMGLRASGRDMAAPLHVAALTPVTFLLVLPLLEPPDVSFLLPVPAALVLFAVALAVIVAALAARLRSWRHATLLTVAALASLLVALAAALPLFIPFTA